VSDAETVEIGEKTPVSVRDWCWCLGLKKAGKMNGSEWSALIGCRIARHRHLSLILEIIPGSFIINLGVGNGPKCRKNIDNLSITKKLSKNVDMSKKVVENELSINYRQIARACA